jgi:hypothetical protein
MHFLMKALPRVAAEMALHVLAIKVARRLTLVPRITDPRNRA